METARTVQKVVASPRFAGVAMLGLAALAMAALDVPQGLADREVLESWSRGTGPFVSLFGLHHLGRGLLTWALLAALGAHAVAARLDRAPGAPATARPWLHAAPLAVALAALAVLGFLDTPASDVRDMTRLVVQPADGSPAQVVEEGSAYRLPGAGGHRTVVFGTLVSGPWAAERRADGGLAVHLPRGADSGTASFGVDARRPLAVPPGPLQSGPLPAPLAVVSSLLAALAAAALMVLAARRIPALDAAGRGVVGLALAGSALLALANPLSGPGTAVVPAGAGALGTPVLHALAARGPGDVADWVGAVPATVAFPTLRAVLVVAALALALVLFVRLVRPGRVEAARLPARVAGALLVAAGGVVAAWTLARLPLPGSTAEAGARFLSDVLARLPASLEVARWAPTAAGPYTLPLSFGLMSLLAFGAPGIALVQAESRPAKVPAAPAWAPAAAVLVLLALVRSATVLAAPAAFHAPAAVVPVSALSAVLAAAALLARHHHPGREAAALVTAVVAAALQLSLAA